jgi:hypothetical protein
VVGGLAIIGLVALLAGACELLLYRPAREQRRAELRRRLQEYPAPPDVVCPWPRLEPEVERLRERGAL